MRLSRLTRAHWHLGNLRVILAAAGSALLWLVVVRAALTVVWLALDAVAFFTIVIVHARVLADMERAGRARTWNERGLERLAGRETAGGRDGAAFGIGHPYSRDLDLFGRGSLFAALNTTRTEAGEVTLADWLREPFRAEGPKAEVPAEAHDIRARQTAVEALRWKIDFREELALVAAEGEISRTGTLARWASSPPLPSGRWLAPVLACSAVVTAALAVPAVHDVVSWLRGETSLDGLPLVTLLLWVLIEAAGIWPWRAALRGVIDSLEKPTADLQILATLLSRIERERFEHSPVTALQARLSSEGIAASRAIAHLTGLVSVLESSMHNLLFVPFLRALFVPEQLALAIDRWRVRYGSSVSEWLRIAGEMEALAALSTFAFDHPDDPFPEILDTGPTFEAESLGHPLLADPVSVRNDVKLGSAGPRLIIISGSNMSGKSTLLRSIGLNVVLALAGAPVRSRKMRLSTLRIGATLRVDDSVQQGYSRFYSEILRIRDMLDAARGPIPLLFLLDEILHGTNSHDRRIGAEGILRALLEAGAIGAITTHDLALAELPARFGPIAVNAHFQDRLEAGRIVFDYRMRPGIIEHSNALTIMRAIGLQV